MEIPYVEFGNHIEEVPSDTFHNMGLHIDKYLLRPEPGEIGEERCSYKDKTHKQQPRQTTLITYNFHQIVLKHPIEVVDSEREFGKSGSCRHSIRIKKYCQKGIYKGIVHHTEHHREDRQDKISRPEPSVWLRICQ